MPLVPIRVTPPTTGHTTPTEAHRLATVLGAQRIPGLDALRAVAVLLVLIDHAGWYRLGPLALFDGGFGVELFFVLSGFLITRLLLTEFAATGRIHLGHFYRRRAARLLPAFYAYLLAGLALLMLRGKPVPWGAVAASAAYVVNYYQALTGNPASYLQHCWSLAVEEQFYLLWPLGLLLILRRGWSQVRALLLVIALVWVLKPLLILYVDVGGLYAYRALELRCDQLALGCLLAVVLQSTRGCDSVESWARRRWALPVLAGLLLWSLNVMRGTVALKYVLGFSLEPVLVALLIPAVVLAAAGRGWAARVLNGGPLVTLGQISYGMYLFHPNILLGVRDGLTKAGAAPALAAAVAVAAVAAVAYVSFRWFEQPLRKRINRSDSRV